MKKMTSALPRLLLFAAAVAMCLYGALTGEAEAVLLKAAKICMECIGLG